MDQNILRGRAARFIAELDIPVSKFAKRIGFSRELYYRWVKGDFNFSNDKARTIDKHLQKYGF